MKDLTPARSREKSLAGFHPISHHGDFISLRFICSG